MCSCDSCSTSEQLQGSYMSRTAIMTPKICACATSTRLILVVWDAGVLHGLETSCPVTNGIRVALVISWSPRCELTKCSNAAPRMSPPFWAQGSTRGTNRRVLTPPSVCTELDSVCRQVLSPDQERVGREFMGEIGKLIFTFSHESAHLRGVLFMHEDVHGHGGGKMSRTAIVAPKICTCTLVSMMVVLIVWDVL